MTPEMVLTIGSRAIMTALMVAGPVLLVGLVVGVALSLFQAVTQINEVSLAFIPKILAMAATLFMFSSWMLEKLMGLFVYVAEMIPLMAN